MKKLSLLFIGFLLIPALFLTSCDRGEDPGSGIVTPAFELMKGHMMANDLDISEILMSPNGAKFVTGAPAEADLAGFLAKYYIIDIRSTDAFNGGHIEGAHNVAFGNILTEAAKAGGKPVLMVCYTGQTACYGTSLLRLAGYSETQALKWGMSGWNPATAGSWNTNTGDIANGHPNWSFNATPPAAKVFEDPTINSLSQDGADILAERVAAVLADGFKTVSKDDVLNTPSSYFVNNYFIAADYTGFGHIVEAYRIKEELKLDGNGYRGMDPTNSAKIATYCYTGQTSAVMTAWLRVLGYDSYSLTFGMNGLYHSNAQWTTNQWGVGSSVPKNLPLK